MTWATWRARITSLAGDDISLVYQDESTENSYSMEFTFVLLNGVLFTQDHEIHEVLDKFLNDRELSRLFAKAQRVTDECSA